jgi:hypothetical protein
VGPVAELTDSVTNGQGPGALPALAFVFSSVFKEPKLGTHRPGSPVGVGASPRRTGVSRVQGEEQA